MNRRLAAFACFATLPILALVTFRLPGAAQDAPEALGELIPTKANSRAAREVAQSLETEHLRRQKIDDALSARMFARYLRSLDPNRSILLASDVLEFARWETELDDAIHAGELEPAFAMFRRFRDRFHDQIAFLQEHLKGDLDSIDFEDGDVIELDRSEAPWPKDRAELEELWRKRVEGEILSLKIAGRETEDIRTLLERRYASQLRLTDRLDGDDVVQIFLNALTLSYDPHTQYLGRKSTDDFDIDMSLSVEGIGALLGNTGEYVQIQELIRGGPAEKSGLLAAQDRLVAVAQGDDEPVDVVGWRTDEVADIVRGPAGSTVRLSILKRDSPEGSPPVIVTIVREAVALEEKAASSKILDVESADGEPLHVGVIVLPDFYMDFEAYNDHDPNYRSTTRDVERELKKLVDQNVDGVVLDLRANGGGSLYEVSQVGGLFVGRKPIVQVAGVEPEDGAEVLRSSHEQMYDGPMLVLVDRQSASASEILAGALQDYGRALIVGERTFGKGTVQQVLGLSSGSILLTNAKFYRVTGASTQRRGVAPDLRIPDGFNEDDFGEESMDEALPWDEIRSAVRNVDKDGLTPARRDLIALLPELEKRHEAREQSDPELRRVVERDYYFESLGDETELSIDESVRRAEQEEHTARLLAIENEYRTAKGETPLASFDELNPADPGDSADPEGGGEVAPEPPKPEIDPIHVEAARIVADYVALLRPR